MAPCRLTRPYVGRNPLTPQYADGTMIDPFVSEAAITAFKKEMQAAHADWELNFYGNAVHAFSNPDADKYGIQGIAYNKGADHRSWQAMLDLFNSVFGEPTAAPGKGHQS